MKLWLPKWLREERMPDDAELERADRRLFLRGLALTSAGLVVGVPLISIPKPIVSPYYGLDRSVLGAYEYKVFCVMPDGRRVSANGALTVTSVPPNAIQVGTIAEALRMLPQHGGGRAVQIIVPSGSRCG